MATRTPAHEHAPSPATLAKIEVILSVARRDGITPYQLFAYAMASDCHDTALEMTAAHGEEVKALTILDSIHESDVIIDPEELARAIRLMIKARY